MMPTDDSQRRGVTLVLPCLDEAESIETCIIDATAAMRDVDTPFEVLVVDNGSTDGSDVLAAQAGARVVYEPVPGYGSALRRGIVEARTDIVVMADADCTYELAKLPALVEPVEHDRADLVLGERLASASNQSMPALHRLVGTPTLSWLNRRAAPGLDVTDSQSGFRAFRRDAVLGLGLQGTGMEYASEMLIQAARAGFRITEIPTEYRVRQGESKLSTFRDGFRHLQLIVLLAPHLLLRTPGLVLLALGLIAAVLGFVAPEGVAVGTLRWQPIFVSTILITIGALGVMAGIAVERFSPLAGPRPAAHTAADDLRLLRRVAVTGGVIVLTGLSLDLALVLVDADQPDAVGRRLALAGAATSLLIVGAIMVAAGLVGRLLIAQLDYLSSRTAHTSEDTPTNT